MVKFQVLRAVSMKMSSGMLRREDWYKFYDVYYVLIASIIRTMIGTTSQKTVVV
jgi:hypothetical protein